MSEVKETEYSVEKNPFIEVASSLFLIKVKRLFLFIHFIIETNISSVMKSCVCVCVSFNMNFLYIYLFCSKCSMCEYATTVLDDRHLYV